MTPTNTRPERRALDRTKTATIAKSHLAGETWYTVHAGDTSVVTGDFEDAKRIEALHNYLGDYAPESYGVSAHHDIALVRTLRATEGVAG